MAVRWGAVDASTDEHSDIRLLEALAGGARGAAEALVDRTYSKVFALLCRLSGGDRDLAADLTQDTYRRAWASLGAFRGEASLSTWLYRIAYNTYLNHVRRPHRVVPLEAEDVERIGDGRRGADEEIADRQLERRLRRAVLDLPEELRATVVARYWAETPVTEIARLDGISEVAVRKRLRRATALLAAAVGGEHR
ncbi:MAG: sigma-70 family RNA polymerase sigma factor [Acidobacteriota bacterium]